MPRIRGPNEPRGPGAVITMPRPREVSARRTPGVLPLEPTMGLGAAAAPGRAMVELGSALSQSGNMLLDHVVEQERSAEATRVKAEVERRASELRGQAEMAGTVAQGRKLWNEGVGKLEADLVRFAEERGLPDAAPGIQYALAQESAGVSNSLAKRAANEGLDAVQLYAAQKSLAMVGASSEPEYTRHKVELHQELQRVAESNPLLTPAAADLMFLETKGKAAHARAGAALESAAQSAEGVRKVRAELLGGAFPDLTPDARADLVKMSIGLEEAAIDRAWQQGRRQETLYREAREKHQLGVMQQYMGRLAADSNVTDDELAASVARGDLDPAAFNFIQSARDNLIENNPDLFVYEDHRTQAEFGMLSSDEVYPAIIAGAYDPDQGRQLLDINTSSRRQGGIMRDAEVEAARDIIDQIVLGAVGDDPAQQFFAFWNASDQERRMSVRLKTKYDEAIRGAIAEGTPPNALNPRRVVGQILRDEGFSATRPRPPMGEFANLNSLTELTAKEIETDVDRGLPAMHARMADGSLSREEQTSLGRDIAAASLYLEQMKQWEANNETMRVLLEALPKSPAGPQPMGRLGPT